MTEQIFKIEVIIQTKREEKLDPAVLSGIIFSRLALASDIRVAKVTAEQVYEQLK